MDGMPQRAAAHSSAQPGMLYRLFAIIAPWVLVAGLPPLIRAGPEGYKGLVIESFLIPLAVLLAACRPRRSPPQSAERRTWGATWKPFLSVLIPCRNEVRSLGRCLASVIAGDYPEDRLEVLVVDGASTDGTRDVIAHWARSHARIRMLENPRRTTPAALNRGIAVASGDVISRLDAHAALTPTYLSRAVEYLETTGAHQVGGVMETRAQRDGPWAGAVVAALPLIRLAWAERAFAWAGRNLERNRAGWTLFFVAAGGARYSSGSAVSTNNWSAGRIWSSTSACAGPEVRSCWCRN